MSKIELYNVDCIEFMRTMPDKSVDAVITDPPYGTTSIKWDKPIDLVSFWFEVERIAKDNAAILVFSAQPFTTDLINSNRKLFRYEIVWKKSMKSGWLNAKKTPLRAHENIVVFYKKLPTYNPQKTSSNERPSIRKGGKDIRSAQYREYIDIDRFDSGMRFPSDVIEFSNWNGAGIGNGATKHPTQKPVPLLSYLVMTYSNPGDTIFDPFFGSGTTAIACVQTGRNFIGCEISEDYFKIAQKRVHDAQQQPTLLP